MRQFISILGLTRSAVAAIAACTFVTRTGAPAEPGGTALGVSRTDAAAGDDMLVDVIGTAVVRAGAAVEDGDEIEVGADATGVPRDEGICVAIALEDAGEGEFFEALIIQNVEAVEPAGGD